MSSESQSKYDWNALAETWVDEQKQRLWRRHADEVNRRLIHRWLGHRPRSIILKNDSFDEGVGPGLFSTLAEYADHVVNMDVATPLLAAARRRYPQLGVVVGDARFMPFATDSIDAIVSNSTLDHFPSQSELEAAIFELARVLKPGGELVLTLDNLSNPVIFARDVLPFGLLNRMGLVPYYVGATAGPKRLRTMVENAGLQIEDTCSIMHCPRVLMVAIARVLERFAGAKTHERFLRSLMSMENLEHRRSKNLTGHFVGVFARKPTA